MEADGTERERKDEGLYRRRRRPQQQSINLRDLLDPPDPNLEQQARKILANLWGDDAGKRPAFVSLAREAQMVEKSADDWRKYREATDRMEAAVREMEANGEPLMAAVAAYAELIREGMQDAYQVLCRRFGLAVVDEMEARKRVRLDRSGAYVDLRDPAEVARLCDALWRFCTLADARLALNRALADGRKRDVDKESAARAACDGVIRVLRSRPLLYAACAFALPIRDREPVGVEEVRNAARSVITGWVRSQTSSKRGTNPRLRQGLENEAVTQSKADATMGEALVEELLSATPAALGQIADEYVADRRALIRDAAAYAAKYAARHAREYDDDMYLRMLVLRILEGMCREDQRLPSIAKGKLTGEASVRGEDDELNEWVAAESGRQDLRRLAAWVESAKLTESEARAHTLDMLHDYDTRHVALEMGITTEYARKLRERYLTKLRRAAGL